MRKNNRKQREGKVKVSGGVGELFAQSSAAPALPVRASLSAPIPISVDLGKYRRHLEHLDIPEERKTELLLALHLMMKNFVDRAFGDDPVQQCRKHVDDRQAKDETGIPPVIHFSDSDPETPDKDLSAAFHDAGKRGRRKR